MEVLYRNQPVFGAQPAAMVYPSNAYSSLSSRMFASPSQQYTCYSFDNQQQSPPPHPPNNSNAPLSPHTPPSRTPTPEHVQQHHHHHQNNHQNNSHHHHQQHHHHQHQESGPMMMSSSSSSSSSSHGPTTLKSVLRGEVPEAYSHFLSSSSSGSSHNNSSSSSSSSSSGPTHLSSSSTSSISTSRQPSPSLLGKRRSPFEAVHHHQGVEASHSPSLLSRGSSAVLSPPPEDVQTEPMDLSCKRPCSASSSHSHSSSGSVSPAAFHHTFPPSPAEDHHQHHHNNNNNTTTTHQGATPSEFSLLRNLLQVGKSAPSSSSSSSSSSFSSLSASPPSAAGSERSCDSPGSDTGSFSARNVCGSTRATLAKKNMFPVSARVSDWLIKVVQFADSIQVFREDLSPSDKLTLIVNSWSRLLLLFMAESNFQFAVTPVRMEPEATESEGGPSPDVPTMKSVEGVQTFIRKCQHMGVESEEYFYLRMLVLFNSSYVGLQEADKVDSFNSQIQQSLQQHVQSARPNDIMHYSRLLMSLPSLYGISAKMVENLFCRHIDSSADMDVMLKDLLHTHSTSSSSSSLSASTASTMTTTSASSAATSLSSSSSLSSGSAPM